MSRIDRTAKSFGILLTLVGLIALTADGFAELVPQERLANWIPGVTVGVLGGIPTNRTQYGSTIPAGASESTIQNALDSCGSEQYVLLSAGSYSISSTLNLKDNATLRGAGIGKTILNTSGSAAIYANGSYNDYNGGGQQEAIGKDGTLISAGATRGSSNVTVSSTSAFSVGGYVELSPMNPTSQYNDPVVVDTGGLSYRLRHQARLTAKTSTQLTFWPPLTWDYTNNCRILQPTQTRTRVGLEDLTINHTNSSGIYAVQIAGTSMDCWMKNVEVVGAANYGVFVQHSVGFEMRGCIIGKGRLAPSSDQSGFLCEVCTGCLIENNTFINGFPLIEINFGTEGSVFAYNFFTNTIWNDGGLIPNHGSHNHHNLFEGNVLPNITGDGYFGSDSHHTYLRNWIYGRAGTRWLEDGDGTGTYGPVVPVRLMRWSRDDSLLGNIISTEYATWGWFGYPNYGTSSSGKAPPWAQWGTAAGANGFQEYDTGVTNTLISKGNRWTYNNSTNTLGGDSLPNSYYLTVKPSWFGVLKWPPIDPGNAATAQVTNIPAGYRFVFGTDPLVAERPTAPAHPIVPDCISGTPRNGPAPLTVQFQPGTNWGWSSSGSNWVLNLGDGTFSTNPSTAHIYSQSGAYNIIVYAIKAGVSNLVMTSPKYITVTNAP